MPNCNSCPCEYADYKNDITDTDKIYAILRNRGLKILYNQSEGVMLSDF
ncbi:hypothetical protein IJM86_00100 [bacterium]|nr:hypothetical protein [bacterium]